MLKGRLPEWTTMKFTSCKSISLPGHQYILLGWNILVQFNSLSLKAQYIPPHPPFSSTIHWFTAFDVNVTSTFHFYYMGGGATWLDLKTETSHTGVPHFPTVLWINVSFLIVEAILTHFRWLHAHHEPSMETEPNIQKEKRIGRRKKRWWLSCIICSNLNID